MSTANPVRFSGESPAYRAARDALLEQEVALRAQVAQVAALRRALPTGHKVLHDYLFERQAQTASGIATVPLSSLFVHPDKSLVLYSFMSTDGAPPCPMCNAFLDSFDGVARHAGSQLNLAVVAQASPGVLADWGMRRGWRSLQLLSSGNTSFNQDYLAQSPQGEQLPMLTVFTRHKDGIYHQYSTELFFAPPEPGQHPRHMDMLYPLWNLFDLTPEGRPDGWMPAI